MEKEIIIQSRYRSWGRLFWKCSRRTSWHKSSKHYNSITKHDSHKLARILSKWRIWNKNREYANRKRGLNRVNRVLKFNFMPI